MCSSDLYTMGTFQGNVYGVDLERRVFKFVVPAERCDEGVVLLAQVPLEVHVYSEEEEGIIGLYFHLVESVGIAHSPTGSSRVSCQSRRRAQVVGRGQEPRRRPHAVPWPREVHVCGCG